MATPTPVEAVRKLLVDDAAVGALVSSRVYTANAPEGAKRPFVTVQQTAGDQPYHMTTHTAQREGTVQVDYYDDTMAGVTDLGEKGFQALSAQTGQLTISVGNDITLNTIHLNNDNTGFFQEDNANARTIKRVSHDYRLFYTKS